MVAVATVEVDTVVAAVADVVAVVSQTPLLPFVPSTDGTNEGGRWQVVPLLTLPL